MNKTKLIRSGIISLAIALSACTMPANSKSSTGGCGSSTPLAASPAGLAQTSLCITSGTKTRQFTVEIARTSMEQAKGMMFRTELADNAGMIFPFPEPKVASFWMKNTVIPLDIIFGRTGRSRVLPKIRYPIQLHLSKPANPSFPYLNCVAA